MLMLICLAILLIGDIVTTRVAIGDGAAEANPIYGGTPTVAKLLITHVLALAGAAFAQHAYPSQANVLWIVVAIFAVIVVHNLLVIRKQKGVTHE